MILKPSSSLAKAARLFCNRSGVQGSKVQGSGVQAARELGCRDLLAADATLHAPTSVGGASSSLIRVQDAPATLDTRDKV